MFKDWFLYSSRFCAVEHAIDINGSERFNCLLLRKKRNELFIEKEESFLSNEELISFLKSNKQQHIVLTINNQQVLSKKIKEEGNQNVVQSAYPNLKLKDFYYQSERSNHYVFIALARRLYVDEILELYHSKGISVLDFSLGNLAIYGITSLFKTSKIYTSNAEIIIESERIIDIELKHFDKKEEYKVNGLVLNNSSLLSLGTVINCYLKSNFYQGEERVSTYKGRIIFKKGYKVILVVCFLILLINFLVFNTYYKKVEQLNNHIDLYNNTRTELNLLRSKVSEKENVLSQIKSYVSSNLSRYVDEIVTIVPSSILLSELNYQPFSSSIKEGKEIKNELSQIKISGSFKNNSDLSGWIDKLERLNWIKAIEKLSIVNTVRGSKFYFSIKIEDGL
ncbi:hypothetical protein [Tenacibaculum caenipelagi]|uniref:Fimbrial assembly protein PilN n=1 Tax=Tenacibaculum caenipelagi TaxID=1325435 RepID=A0A4R6T8W4_9FLAO|nr:hypothetical protein [Tenacibaculum caenipelagi]TDQ21831.1 hypothetical protein DFQ07_2926 [Tenacibaculum caenipelagi]